VSPYSTGLSDCEFGPLVVKPKEARRMLACGNTRLYELLNAGELDSFLDGRARKITIGSIRAYIAKRLQSADGVAPQRPPHSKTERATAASLAARKRRIQRCSRPPGGSSKGGDARKSKSR
jgi:hypothetical protein